MIARRLVGRLSTDLIARAFCARPERRNIKARDNCRTGAAFAESELGLYFWASRPSGHPTGEEISGTENGEVRLVYDLGPLPELFPRRSADRRCEACGV